MREYNLYKEKILDVKAVNSKTTIVSGIREFITTVIHSVVSSIVVLFLVQQVIDQKILPGEIITIMSIINQ
jgi:ABC-type bacteriocin/lantibiotic exporter with double-glycine peptidase domain